MNDFAKVFNVVDRELLLYKLNALDAPVTIKRWLSFFLSNRSEQTAYSGMISDELQVNLGVVQVSALGPILFVIFLADLQPVGNSCDMIKFADDVTILVPEHS